MTTVYVKKVCFIQSVRAVVENRYFCLFNIEFKNNLVIMSEKFKFTKCETSLLSKN